MTVVALVGAQLGSEGKGAVAARIANDFDVHVRTGAPNAGHTYYINDPSSLNSAFAAGAPIDVISEGIADEQQGRDRIKIVARSVPVGACNTQAHLVIGAGGILDVKLLLEEVDELDALGLDVRGRLLVDAKALVIDPVRHHAEEGGIHGQAHRLIGSTGEGVGLARMAHINRDALLHGWAWTKVDHVGDPQIRDRLEAHGIKVRDDTSHTLNEWINAGAEVLLEGTQGSGLSSVHGPWPFCTSTDTNAAQLLVDSGISPRKLTSVILVARTYPIRVAGNSGPLERELQWEDLGVEPETTTVTKKVRRVGYWDDRLFAKAVELNGPYPRVAITFMDYIDKECAGIRYWDELPPSVIEFINEIRSRHDVEVAMVGTGPDSICLSPHSGLGRR